MIRHNLPQDWPLPTAYMIELGRIFVLWGSLESAVNLAISKLAGYEGTLDWRVAVMTAHSNFKQKIDIIATLCDELQHQYSHLSNYKPVINKIRKVQTQRNNYAHNCPFFNQENGKIETASMSARGSLKTIIQEIKLEDLKDLNADIHEAMIDLHQLVTQVRYPPIWERNC